MRSHLRPVNKDLLKTWLLNEVSIYNQVNYLMLWHFDLTFNRVNILTISDVNLNPNCLISVKIVILRSQLTNCNTIEITNQSAKYDRFWSNSEENQYEDACVKNSHKWVSSIAPTK